jgi:hypothetical protein
MLKNHPDDIKLATTKFPHIYRAVVEDNNDPLMMGRVRVRIFGLHTAKKVLDATEGVPTDELPWAEPVCGLIEGSISGYGLWAIPLQGSHVMLFFENGNYSSPRYFGTVPGIPASGPDTTVGFNDPDGEYPDKTGVSDFHENARGSSYPNNIVLATHGGHIIEIDSSEGSETLKISYDTGGTSIEFSKSTNAIDIVGDIDINVTGNCNVTVTGNLIIQGATIQLN